MDRLKEDPNALKLEFEIDSIEGTLIPEGVSIVIGDLKW